MERFLNIDWNLPLEDLIDTVFVHDDRLEQESAMYKIMRGNFADPFKDIDDDYNEVNIDLISQFEGLNKTDTSTVTATKTKCEKRNDKPSNVRTYVPGIVKPVITFPRSSSLSKEQHCICLKVLSTFFGSETPDMTQSNREDLETYYVCIKLYLALQNTISVDAASLYNLVVVSAITIALIHPQQLKDVISKEQNEYLELAKQSWDCSKLKVSRENYINKCWKIKMEKFNNLPRYYTETLNIPLIGNQKVNLTFLSTCLRLGKLEAIELPTLNKPFILNVTSTQLEKQHTTSCSQSSKSVVSADPICEKLAIENDADLVITPSGLYTILNNIGPNFINSWILPVVVKVHDNKHTIYIDKPAPPTSSTVPEKNTWVYKHILKYHLLGSKSSDQKTSRPGEYGSEEDSIFGNVNSDDLLKLEQIGEKNVYNGDCNKDEVDKLETDSRSNTYEAVPASYLSSITKSNNPEIVEDLCSPVKKQCLQEEKKHFSKDHETGNITYNLFSLNPQSLERSEFLKNNVTKQYKVLIRSTADGIENDSTENDTKVLMIAPKLEHQVSLGAEAITVDEGLKQWAMLAFRPGASLARVRLSAKTSEVLQIEKRSAMSINRELRRLHNISAEDTLTTLYNVIQELVNVPPGRYIMRHIARNGAFVTIYKETDKAHKNAFDLHTVSGTLQYNTIPVAPWPMLDKMTTTPMLKCFERMPCMFYPPKTVKTGEKRKFKKNTGRKANAGQLRRSPRNKSES